jgi:hypothetical protein
MVGYICKHCKFRTDKDSIRECPWCGRNSLEKEKSANELLDDINNILEE